MEEFDIFDSDIDNGSTGSEKASEITEKQREGVKKAAELVKKAGKDESRGRAYSDILAKVIVQLLRSEKNDPVRDVLLALLKENAPSSFVLSAAAIANDAAYAGILEHFNKKGGLLNGAARGEKTAFKESVLDPEERNRINEWVELLFLSLTTNTSVIFMKKFLEALERKDEKNLYTESIAILFALFLESRNIAISHADALAYADFILLQLQKRLLLEKVEHF